MSCDQCASETWLCLALPADPREAVETSKMCSDVDLEWMKASIFMFATSPHQVEKHH